MMEGAVVSSLGRHSYSRTSDHGKLRFLSFPRLSVCEKRLEELSPLAHNPPTTPPSMPDGNGQPFRSASLVHPYAPSVVQSGFTICNDKTSTCAYDWRHGYIGSPLRDGDECVSAWTVASWQPCVEPIRSGVKQVY